MRPPELETWFREYRDRHDGEALARVFDASAAKLLLIAQHLTRDASAAEDLVQTTFLTAIESAKSWDERQPLFPWLAGILANRARMLRRGGRALPEPRALRDRASEDPSEAAAAHEIDRALMAAIEALPATYRDVLVLRLVHGLAGVEIAHALSRSPETVRTQLHRGLERLRQALPKGLLTPTILALLASDGLAAVRARVLAAAVSSAAPAMLAVAGTLTMKKLALAILPLALLGTWWALGAGGISGSASSGAAAAAAAAGATSKPSSEEHSDAAPERVAVPAARSEARALLRGRCVAAESGRGIPGAEIRFQGYGRTEEDRTGHPDIRQRIRSGADGSFEFAFDPPPGHCFFIRVLAAQRATVGADWNSWRKDATLDLGDVALPLGTRLLGRVVDQQGNPIRGASLMLSGAKTLPCGNQPGKDVYYSGPTKADGSFAYEDPLPAGTIRLQVSDGYEQLEDCVLELLAGERSRDVTITVRTPDPAAILAGTIVDDTGLPVAGVTVEACGRDRAAARPVKTDSTGAFLLRNNGNTDEPVRLIWSTEDARSDPNRSPSVRWGTRDIRLVAARPLSRELGKIVVVDARTKEPVEEFGVLGVLEPAQLAESNGREPADARCGHHDRGEMQLPRSTRGPQNLLVLPKDPAYAPSDLVSFDPARQGSMPLRIALDRPALLRVRVRAADGAPIVGTRIEAWRWLFTTQDAPWSGGTVPEPLPEHGVGLQGAYRLAEATTDAAGSATLPVTRNLQNLLVQAVGPGHVRLARGGVASGDGGSELDLVVQRGATITGKVLPLGIVTKLDTTEPAPAPNANDPTIRGGMPANRRPGLSLVHTVESGTSWFRLPTTPEPFPLADDGSFRIANVPPGEWQLCLFTFHFVASGGTYGPEQPPLATLTLAEGGSQELTLDASQFLPCAISGHVLLDGKPLAGAGLTLFRAAPGASDESLSTDDVNPTSEDGAFAQPHAKAGVHRLRVYVVDPLGRSQTTYFSDATLAIAPGEGKTWEVRLQTRRLEVQVLDAEGKALPAVGVRVGSIATMFTQLLPTDRDGIAVLEPAPPIDLTITVRTPDCPDPEFWRLPPAEQKKRTVALGTHRVSLDRRVTRLELRLPPVVR